jgi:hypothetical protein
VSSKEAIKSFDDINHMPPRKELPIEGVNLESTYMELFDAELPQSNTSSTKIGYSLDEE